MRIIKHYVLVKDLKSTAKKIILYVPDELAGEIEVGKEFYFKGKLTSKKDSDYMAEMVFESFYDQKSAKTLT